MAENKDATPPIRPVLPTELLEAVINRLNPEAQAGREALLSCSYAGSALLPVAQRRLFQNTTVRFTLELERDIAHLVEDLTLGFTGRKLLDLLNQSPHIASYIRSFNILSETPPWRLQAPSATVRSSSPSFPLYAIIPKLSQLEELSLTGSFWLYSWRHFDPTIWKNLNETVKKMTRLDLSPLKSVPSSFLLDCHSLQELRMGSLLIERNAGPSMRPALKLLSVRLEHENQDREESLFTSIDAPFCPFDVSRLSRLIVSINDLSEINRTLKSCCETLERLELPSLRSAHASTKNIRLLYNSQEAAVIPFYDKVVPELGSLHRLRTIVISCLIYGHVDKSTYDTDLPYACAILRGLPCQNHALATVLATLDVTVVHVPERNLADIPWSEIIGINLPEEFLESSSLRIQLRLRTWTRPEGPFRAVSLSRVRDVLDENEYMVSMKHKGLITYDVADEDAV